MNDAPRNESPFESSTYERAMKSLGLNIDNNPALKEHIDIAASRMKQAIRAIERSSPKHINMISQQLTTNLSGMQDRFNIGGPSFVAESTTQSGNFSFQDSWDTQANEPPRISRKSYRTEHSKNWLYENNPKASKTSDTATPTPIYDFDKIAKPTSSSIAKDKDRMMPWTNPESTADIQRVSDLLNKNKDQLQKLWITIEGNRIKLPNNTSFPIDWETQKITFTEKTWPNWEKITHITSINKTLPSDTLSVIEGRKGGIYMGLDTTGERLSDLKKSTESTNLTTDIENTIDTFQGKEMASQKIADNKELSSKMLQETVIALGKHPEHNKPTDRWDEIQRTITKITAALNKRNGIESSIGNFDPGFNPKLGRIK